MSRKDPVVGVGVPDDPSGKFDLDGQIFPHGTELPPAAVGTSRTPSPTVGWIPVIVIIFPIPHCEMVEIGV